MIGANKNRHDLNFDIAIGKLESLQVTGRGGLGKKALFGGIHNLATRWGDSHLTSFSTFNSDLINRPLHCLSPRPPVATSCVFQNFEIGRQLVMMAIIEVVKK